jgi:uncharacterized membrane protein YjdF
MLRFWDGVIIVLFAFVGGLMSVAGLKMLSENSMLSILVFVVMVLFVVGGLYLFATTPDVQSL